VRSDLGMKRTKRLSYKKSLVVLCQVPEGTGDIPTELGVTDKSVRISTSKEVFWV